MENVDKNRQFKYRRDYRVRHGRQRYYNNYKNDFAPRSRRYSPPRDQRSRKRHFAKKKFFKKPSRPNSPVIGSEEYMTQKIQKTSAIIMRHLLTPEDNVIQLNNSSNCKPTENDILTAEIPERQNGRKRTRSFSLNESVNKKSSFDVGEIHNKIMNHISKLNNGRKKNLISTGTSIYDEAIDQILKQKRLEISRALRNVCNETSDITESTDWINSIIPDIGIKIEDLPKEILEELQISFSNHEDLQTLHDKSAELEKDFSSNVVIKMEDEDSPVEVVEILASDINTEDSSTPYLELEQENEGHLPVRSEEERVNIENEVVVQREIEDDDIELVVQPESVETIIIDEEPGNEKELQDPPSLLKQKKKRMSIGQFLNQKFPCSPQNFREAVNRMLVIDGYIAELTKYRQNLFNGLKIKNSKKTKKKKKKKVNNLSAEKEKSEEIHSQEIGSQQKLLNFQVNTEKMLVLRICEDKLVAGTESGKIYFFSLEDAQCVKLIQVTTVPISCLHYTKAEDQGKPYMFVGSFESHLKVYNFYSVSPLQDIFIEDSVQCMDENWGYLFLGCIRGTILRYSIKKNVIEYEEQFDTNPIFVLKATQEGARKVLLIGSRNSSVLIRDAMSGLHLRTMDTIVCPTVYCIIMDKHFVYCGTTSHDILMYNFNNGKLLKRYKATNARGIGCMKIVGNCLFASCHNGQVYVYNLVNNSFAGTLTGPGGVILSMEVLKNQVIVGTMSCKFSSIPIPLNILSQM